MIRPTAGEKLEIIRLVEESQLTVRQTLVELDIPSSTFYRWYQRYLEAGLAGLQEGLTAPRRFWNRIPESVRDRVVHLALAYPDKSPRELACFITDHEEYFLSESSVYRILKGFDLVTSPAFQVVSASDHFKNPTTHVNEMWQTDFTQFRLLGWGWYYLSTVLDDYSRYILAWKLSPTMDHTDVEDVLKQALGGQASARSKSPTGHACCRIMDLPTCPRTSRTSWLSATCTTSTARLSIPRPRARLSAGTAR